MTIDITEGDILVLTATGKEYPVKRVRSSDGFSISPSFRRTAVLAATTKRSSVSGGKRLPATATSVKIKITRFSHVSADLASTLELDTPHRLLRCYAADSDGYVMLVVEDQRR